MSAHGVAWQRRARRAARRTARARTRRGSGALGAPLDGRRVIAHGERVWGRGGRGGSGGGGGGGGGVEGWRRGRSASRGMNECFA